jgi:hypothetical protein
MARSDLMRTGKSLATGVAGARAHVAIILIARQASGAEHQTLALARALQSHVRVTVLTCDEFAGLVATDPFLREYTRGLAIIALGPAFPVAPATTASGLLGRILAYPRLQQRLWTVWRQLRPDVVHLVLAPSFFAFAPWFLMRAGRTVITLAGEARYMRHFYGTAKRLAVLWAIARADRLVVCSADELVNLEVVAPGHSTRATVIDNFTDTASRAQVAAISSSAISEEASQFDDLESKIINKIMSCNPSSSDMSDLDIRKFLDEDIQAATAEMMEQELRQRTFTVNAGHASTKVEHRRTETNQAQQKHEAQCENPWCEQWHIVSIDDSVRIDGREKRKETFH